MENLWGQWASLLQETKDKAFKLSHKGRRFVIFSDLHMGNGGTRDDFAPNGPAFQKILTNFYLPGEYDLILNGDIEELQKFQWEQIRRYWKPLYAVFEDFNRKGKLHKTVGNHDLILSGRNMDYPFQVHESLEIHRNSDSLLVYHGHQFSHILRKFETLCKFAIQYVAYPLGIMNYSKSPDSRKKLKTELRAYEASRQLGLISIIGHTHRPLFESLSKKDSLKYRIDTLIRRYRSGSQQEQIRIRSEIRQCQEELNLMKDNSEFHISELYSSETLLPCLFNSGCAIGKRGITSLEIHEDEIQLIYWYDQSKISTATAPIGYNYHEIPGSTLRRVILNRERLDYIQDKIRLMNPQPSLFWQDTSLPFQPLPD